VVLFFISDLLYGTKESNLFHLMFISFFIAVLLVIIIEFLKRKMKLHF